MNKEGPVVYKMGEKEVSEENYQREETVTL